MRRLFIVVLMACGNVPPSPSGGGGSAVGGGAGGGAADAGPSIGVEHQALSADGLIGKIDFDHATVVGEPFYALDFEDKRSLAFLVVMEGMAHRKRADFDLVIVDRKNGKTVGYWHTATWTFSYDGP